jgi:hypothetical protein
MGAACGRPSSKPVTVADNCLWWAQENTPLAAEVDFVGVHTYPVREGRTPDEAMACTVANLEPVHAALPGGPIAALDEPWKGSPDDSLGAERHRDLFKVDRSPREAMR